MANDRHVSEALGLIETKGLIATIAATAGKSMGH